MLELLLWCTLNCVPTFSLRVCLFACDYVRNGKWIFVKFDIKMWFGAGNFSKHFVYDMILE